MNTNTTVSWPIISTTEIRTISRTCRRLQTKSGPKTQFRPYLGHSHEGIEISQTWIIRKYKRRNHANLLLTQTIAASWERAIKRRKTTSVRLTRGNLVRKDSNPQKNRSLAWTLLAIIVKNGICISSSMMKISCTITTSKKEQSFNKFN